MTGYISIDKAQQLFRFFDLNATAIAQARSLAEQEQQGIEEEDQVPTEFESDLAAFQSLIPPPVVDEEGVEHEVEELTFQDFCHMTMFPKDLQRTQEPFRSSRRKFGRREGSDHREYVSRMHSNVLPHRRRKNVVDRC
eukprot:c2163_g1_i1.p1 GENE.c2163_g1_i1~~c2163_g1_i1.p1  ORF type:complete len:138 (+),score=32.15 c2163_g1_i1:91-504(+)